MAFADRSLSLDQDVQEISRFSCMLFLSVRGFSDYAGPSNPLATSVVAVLPSSTRNGVGVLFHRLFEAQSPGPPIPLSTLQATPRDIACKTRGQDGFAALLSCRALSSPTTCRFIPALSGLPTMRELSCRGSNRNVENGHFECAAGPGEADARKFEVHSNAGDAGQLRVGAKSVSVKVGQRVRRDGVQEIWHSVPIHCDDLGVQCLPFSKSKRKISLRISGTLHADDRTSGYRGRTIWPLHRRTCKRFGPRCRRRR